MKRLGALVPAVLVGLLLAGCGPTDPMRGQAASDLPPGPLQPLPTHSTEPTAACTDLRVSGGATERSSDVEYLRLHFTNTGSDPCTVRGYPALTLKDSANRQVGESARPYSNGGAKDLTLAPQETVTADVRFPRPGAAERTACQSGTVRIEVLIPEATDRAFVTDSHPYCPGWSVSALHRGSA